MRRKDQCPACHTINLDGWTTCVGCGKPAPPPVAHTWKRRGPCHAEGELTKPDMHHLLWCLQRVVVHDLPDPKVHPDLFWRRHTGLVRMLKRLLGVK